MNQTNTTYLQGQVVEEEIELTLIELCQACDAPEEQITIWVLEGMLEPYGPQPQEWRFSGAALQRARLAVRLTRDLEINPAGVALALDLLDEIAALKTQLKRRSAH
ncbi:MAG: MerR family transcriptional regulator [Glaciimonas sp.]|nr:MerR family transcriptional regulator [Glaciimonas sp.]